MTRLFKIFNMTHLEIIEGNFNRGMLGVKSRLTTFLEFKTNYPSLLKVILKSMEDVERHTNSKNLEHLKKQ